MSDLVFVAVARRRDLPALRVLAGQLTEHHPGAPLQVLLLPGLGPRPRSDEPFTVTTAFDAGHRDVGRLLADAPPSALEALVRPLALVDALAAGARRAVLVAPETDVRAPLTELLDLLEEADAVVVPRLLGTLPDDGLRPDAQDVLEEGVLEDGLLGVRDSEAGHVLLEWWADRARAGAQAAAQIGATPPRSLALPLDAGEHLPGDVRRLEHPGFAVSYWNLHERELTASEDGLLVGGVPVRTLSLPGFRPDRPWWLSPRGTRVLVLGNPALETLLASRAASLLEAGWKASADLEDLPHFLPGGVELDTRVRRLLLEAVERGEDFGDVTAGAGAEALLTWLNEPAPHGAGKGITRYHWSVWQDRPDVQEAYPHLDGEHGDGFCGWLWTQGRSEMGLQTRLMPPWPTWLGDPPDEEDAPPELPTVTVTGFLGGTLGLGQAARAYTAALQASGIDVATHAVRPDPPVERMPRGTRPRDEDQPWEDLRAAREPEVQILCVNPEQLPGLAAEIGLEQEHHGHRIGVFGWEVEGAPEGWRAAFDVVDEVWVYSSWVAEQVSRAGDVPVVVMPLPVEAPAPSDAPLPFDLGDAFTFLFVFDHFSTLARKNPLGLIDAFKRAFGPGEGPQLVIKTINGEHRPEARERMRYATEGRDDILIVDRTLTRPQLDALFARSDAYVSLHRAEGFGLTLAETMAVGKPVIATGYSGNTDFMTPVNSLLVDYELVRVGDEAEHYPADARWAEPSIEDAARAMREVVEHPEEARRRGDRARRDIAQTLSTEACGAHLRHRLERIAAWRQGRPRPSQAEPAPLSDLDALLSFPLTEPSARGVRSSARKAVLEVLTPYVSSERRYDEAVAASLHRLHFDLVREQAHRERLERRLALLERRLGRPGATS